MRFPVLALGAVLLAACERPPLDPVGTELFPAMAGPERTLSYSTIAVPDALATTAYGINARGDIVGQYVDENFMFHGFLLRNGVFTTIDYPGAEGTQARGIGPGGEIVGTYWMAGEPAVNVHGFLLTRDGTFVPVDYPGHTNTIAQRILPDGTIVGCRHDDDTMGSMKGVTITAAGASEIDAFASMHNGATPDLRRIVGLYLNQTTGLGEAYIIDDGVFEPLVIGTLGTQAWDVNPAGEVTGIYRDGTGFHGFVLTGRGVVTLDYPGASATRAFGINAGGDVVGNYTKSGVTYGFVASATKGHTR